MRPFALILGLCGLLGAGYVMFGHGKNTETGAQREQDRPTLPVPGSDGEMALIPSGEFTMGKKDDQGETRQHRVLLSAFYIDKHLVTQSFYERVMGANPSKFKDKHSPVSPTQWTDAARFCNKCSEREGLKPCYDLTTWKCDFTANGYRLPTEAEWEYACRAGSAGTYCFGDDAGALSRHAWFKDNSGGRPHPVGQKIPNAWGLFDMHGNVWQWCNDYFAADYDRRSLSENPRGPETGSQRVLRGGSYDANAAKCASSHRFKEFPVFADACFGSDAYGFRRVRNASGAAPAPVSAAEDTPKPEAVPGEARHANEASNATPLATPAGKLDTSRLKGSIVFASDRSGTLNLWIMDANGKNQRPFTRGEDASVDPCFSPGRKRILFTTLRQGVPEVWSMSRDGSDARKIAQGCQGSWSPDGASIVFIRDNQAYVREMNSGKEKRVTPEAWERCGVPAWSPDGKRIAVASRHTGTIGIFTVDLNDQTVAQIATKHPACTPCWSKDGKRLLCQTVKGHVQQVDAGGGDVEQLTFGADIQHDARYSPDGSMLLYCRAPSQEGPWQIWVMPINGEEADGIQLTSEGSNSHPDWIPED